MTRKSTKNLACLSAVALGLLAQEAIGGSAFFDFNSDPSLSGLLTNYGSCVWSAVGGAGSATNGNDGFLIITTAKSQSGSIIFSDTDNGQVVKAFTFEADVKMGNGNTDPADGFSVNYVRANDPALADAEAGGTPSHWATGPNCEANLPEEGTQTGISIGFDAWASGGSSPYCNEADQAIGADIIAVSVRVDGTLVLQFPTPTKNGSVTDPTSLQTGPNDGTGNPDILSWAHVKVVLDTNAMLNVYWKNSLILSNYQTTYFPSPGRLVFAGRTGDNWQNQFIDNIAITTIPAAVALVGAATGLPDGFSVVINDSGNSVVDTTKPVVLTLDGTTVNGATVAKNGGATTITYHGFPILLASGSTHKTTVTAKDTNGNTISGSPSFTVPTYSVIPGTDAVVSGVDTSRPGMRVLPWQSGSEPNRVYWANEQLAGLHGANDANLTGATDGGYMDFTRVLNFNNNPASSGGGDAGNFTTANGYADTTFPGIPGANGLNGSTAIEVLCFLQFQNAGIYQMGVNSDDGFAVTEGKNPKDRFALNLGQYDGGRGSSDSIFTFAVTNAGIYPFRLLYFNGAGELPGNGANLEWFTVQNGAKILVNDPSATNTTGIKAFYSGPVLPAYVSQVNPLPGATGVRPDTLLLQLTDAGSAVNSGSIQAKLNGVSFSPTITKSGNVTTVALPSGMLLASGSSNFVGFVWSDNGTPLLTHSNTWSFTVQNYVTLDAGLSAPLGTQNTSKPGFTLQTVQLDPSIVGDSGDGLPNQMDSMEALMAGLYFPWYGTNVVDKQFGSQSGIPSDTQNIWYWSNYLDFNIANTSPTGDFPYDMYLPGIPGLTLSSANLASVFTSWIVFPSAGYYQMGVNSDDGFRVTEATSISRQVLHVTGPGGIDTDVAAVLSTTNWGNPGFGGSLPVTPIVAPVMLVNSNNYTPGAAINLSGKIAVVDTGLYGASDPVLSYIAQTNGALAVIVINNPTYGLPYVMTGTSPGPIHIPALNVNGFGGQRDFWLTNANLTVSIGADSHPVLGAADYGKGVGDVNFGFVVPSAGVYPIRTLYFQGGGGAAVELYSLTEGVVVDPTHILVNDTNVVGSLIAYREVTVTPRPTLSLSKQAGAWIITYTGTLQSSPTLKGTYTDVSGAVSPYTMPIGPGAMQFYRARP